MPSIEGITAAQLGEVQLEKVEKNDSIIAMPLGDSDQAEVDQQDGAITTITIDTIITGDDSELQSSSAALRALPNGDQTISNGYPKLYTSERHGNILVKFESVTLDAVAGDPRRMTCTIKMIESSDSV